jgi:hypothetical protein
MWRCSRSNRWVVWAVVLTVLAVRASDTHLHLCFDGQEPSTTVHFADASVHHDEVHKDQNHADKDVDPFVGALAKNGDTDTHVVLTGFAVVPVLMPLVRDAPPILPDLSTTATGPPFYLRPPLRGPPA